MKIQLYQVFLKKKKIYLKNFILVILFNPLAWKVKKFISIPVFRNDLMVTDFNQKTIFYQVNPSRVSYSTPCLSPGTCGSSSNNGFFYLIIFFFLNFYKKLLLNYSFLLNYHLLVILRILFQFLQKN